MKENRNDNLNIIEFSAVIYSFHRITLCHDPHGMSYTLLVSRKHMSALITRRDNKQANQRNV